MSDKKKTFDGEHDMPLSSISSGTMRWNTTGSWRNVKPFYDAKTSPCIGGCPGGLDIQGYIALTKEKSYEEAVRLIWERNPFPAICGRVCYHPCVERCLRGGFDDAIDIPAIERFLGDYAIRARLSETPPEERRNERVAVVGGGPAGMSCAYYLAKRGFRVTCFEAKAELGGVLRYGIPPYRLPKDVLDAELARLADLGVEVKPNTAVGRDVTIEELSDFSAFFVGVGLQKSRSLGLDGEDIAGVMFGLDFLEAVNTGKGVEVGEHAVVVGGGNTAMDVARSALRIGAKVTVLYRRTRDEMPAIDDEVREAAQEGVDFHFLATPVEILSDNGRIQAIRCQEMELGEPDESGRRRPVPKEGAFFEMPADALLLAAGELPDTAAFESVFSLANGLIVADEFGKTSRERVFAGGDVVSGASTVINAIARGRGAAELIAAELTGGKFNPEKEKKFVQMADLNTAYFYHKRRAEMRRLHGQRSDATFAEVNAGLSDVQVQEEVERCFSCGVCDGCDNCWVFCPDAAIYRSDGKYTIDYDYCKGCLICVEECPRGVFSTESEAK